MGFSTRLRFCLKGLPPERVPVLGPASSKAVVGETEVRVSVPGSSEEDLLLLRLPLGSESCTCSIGA